MGLLAVEEPVPWLGSVRPEHGDRADGADRRDADKHLGVPQDRDIETGMGIGGALMLLALQQ